MKLKYWLPGIHHFTEIFLIAAAYYLTARLSLLWTQPTGNINMIALWIPAGVAMAAALIFGPRVSIGVFAGSLLANWERLSGPAGAPIAATIAAGAALQAWAAAVLLRRFVSKLPPNNIGTTLLTTFLLAVTTLLAPLASVTSLTLGGLSPWGNYLSRLGTWWLGDFVGILIFAPTLVVLFARKRKQRVNEPLLWPLTSFLVGLSLLIFYMIHTNQQLQADASIQQDVDEMVQMLESTINQHDMPVVNAIPAFYNSTPMMTRAQFSSFITPFLHKSKTISAISWVLHVPGSERAIYEQAMRAEGFSDFFIYEKDAQGNKLIAAERPEYFPVTFIEPLQTNQAVMGFDNASNPERLTAILTARDSGETVVTAPIQLLQDSSDSISILIVQPVYRRGPPQSLEDRRANLVGVAVGAYRVSALMKNAMAEINQHDIELYLYDVEDPDNPRFLGFYPSLSGPQSLPAGGAPEPSALQTGSYRIASLNIGNRSWMAIARTGPEYPRGSNDWAAWTSLLIGALLTGGFLTYVRNRQQTEARLAQSEAEFRALSDTALTGVMRLKPSGEIIYANRAMAQIVGLDRPENLMRLNFRSILSDPVQVDTFDRAFQTSNQVYNQEFDLLIPNAEKKHVLYSATLLKGVISATLVDITERIRSEKEFRQLSRIVSQMADTVVITDIDGVIEYVNPAFKKLTGYSRDEALGATPRILKSGMHTPAFYDQLWDTILRGKVFQNEIINRKKNGEIYYETKTITPIRDASGAITHFVATGKDITEHRKTEQALRHREEEYRLISENTGDVIWILDIESQRFIYVSPSVEKLRGYPPQEVLAQPINEVLTPESLTKLQTLLPERLAIFTQEHLAITYTDELDQLRRDGSIVSTEVSTTFVVNSVGKLQVVGISRDITERKQAARLQETVYRIAEAVHTSKSLQDLYPQIHRQIASVMYAENFYIALYDEDTDLCSFVYSVDEKDARSVQPFHPGEGLTSQVLRTGKSLLFTPEARRTQSDITLIGTPAQIWLGAPLVVQGKTIGVMAVQHYSDPQAFGEREQHMLEYVCAQVATAIDRKRVEEAVRVIENRNSILIQNAPDGIVMVDARGVFTFASPSAYRMFGYTREDIIGHNALEKIHPDDLRPVQRGFRSLMQDASMVVTIEYRFLRKDGAYRWVEATFSNLLSEPGVNAVVNNFRDITERKQSALLQDTVYRIAEAAQSAESLQELYAQIHHHISNVMYAENFYIALYDEHNDQLRFVYSVDEKDPFTSEPFAPGAGLTGIVLRRGQSLLCDSAMEQELLGQGVYNRVGTPSEIWLGVPLIVHAKTIGVMAVQHYSDPHAFTQREQHILEFVSSQVATAIDRKLAGELLLQSQSSLEMAQSVAHLGNWDLDLEAGMGYWSKEMFQLFHHDPTLGPPIFSEFLEMIHPDDRQPLLASQQQVIDSGIPASNEYCSNPARGEMRYFFSTTQPVWDAQGKIVKLSGTVLDITALKTAQHELEALNHDLEKRVEERTMEVRQSEATYRALFENSNDGIFLISPQGVEVKANIRGIEMLGYTPEEYEAFIQSSGGNPMALTEEQADANARFEAVLRSEYVPLYDRTLIRKDGTPVHTEINLSAVRDPNGQIILVQSVVRDISERKKAEEALRESRDRLSAANIALEKASRLKDEFLASMSHELRTPLTGILGLSEALQLQTYGPLTEKQIKSLKTIESSGRHLLDLINDILDLSKIEAGKLDMQFEMCAVGDICQASLQLIKGMAHQKKQNITFSMNPSAITARADARRLKQILVNLLSNAVNFTPEGGKLGLEVKGSDEENLVRFTVWDQGIGIKSENLPKLFKPFMQLDSSLSRQYSGTGLGLSLVQRMAELHGGRIQVESVYGEGSRFTVTLPWNASIQVAPADLKKSEPGPLKNTLVIEDNLVDADQVSRYLKGIGITNTIHPTKQGALEKAAAMHPSIILLDLHLPDGFGIELLSQLKSDERTRDIPVIITSAEERRAEAKKLGASGYLVKPYSQQELQAELIRASTSIPSTNSILVVASRVALPLIMVADDNEVILEMVGSFLEVNKFRVVCVRSGHELLERAPTLRPDLILMDIQMPGLDGMEATRRMRAHSDTALAATPIIAVTALAMAGDREKCLEAGANDYLSKPIVLTQLVKKINQLLTN